MKEYKKRLTAPKTVDPKLISKRRDHTLLAVEVEEDLLPVILSELISNGKLSITRAMNYSRTLYNQFHLVPLHKLHDLFAHDIYTSVDTIEFSGSIDPSTFRNYTYWYSRFLFHVVMFKYHHKYQTILDIDLRLLKVYMYSECRRGLKPETVSGILSAIKHMLYPFRKHFDFLYNDDILYKKFFQCLYKVFGRPRKHKIQITYFLMVKIVSKLDFTILLDLRDWVLMVIAHVGGFRGGEVCPAKWSDIAVDKYQDTFSGRQMLIFVLFLDSTKTTSQGDGAVVTISCPSEVSSFNVLSVVLEYIHKLEEHGFINDYLFPSLRPNDRGLNKHIKVATMSHAFKRLYKMIGGDPKDISSHSARGGMVEDAVAAGIPEEFIQRLGRWRSKAWRGYFHDEQYAQACATAQLHNQYKKYVNDDVKKQDKILSKALSKH